VNPHAPDQDTLRAAVVDARLAESEFDDARAWLENARQGPMDPIAADVWAFDSTFQQILLIRHRWRGCGVPGGMVERGETPREAARRELVEETGTAADLLGAPAAVTVRSYHSDWTPTLGLTYAAVVDHSLPLSRENHQPAALNRLTQDWTGAFPEDITRIRRYAKRISGANQRGCQQQTRSRG
jgi:8-oxo-dGTP diphosphatase